jgi:hypothetical protein
MTDSRVESITEPTRGGTQRQAAAPLGLPVGGDAAGRADGAEGEEE